MLELGIDCGVEVHSSLSSMGYVEGGADAAATALVDVFGLVMVPAFVFGIGASIPEGVRIERNGWRPRRFHRHRHRWTPVPFHKDLPSSRGMGAITEAVRKMEGSARGIHPTHSFAAVGEGAEEIIGTQTYDNPMAPVTALADRGGWVLMLGTELTSCTALHAAEVAAGRPYFIRYCIDEQGKTFRANTPGCSRGFGRFEPLLAEIGREVLIGTARVRAYPCKEMLEIAADAIRRDPDITRCRPQCQACADMIAGGPIVYD
ncbi:MAG: AAC(3) family N-acetyltransferase [Planctomycetota bacterium]